MKTLHHTIAGRRAQPPVLFLHGFMGAVSDWIEVTDALRRTFFCIAADLPGHGQSAGMDEEASTMAGASRALVDLLDALALPQANVVGYSMGGRLALYFALHHPARCRKLVLESASPGLATEVERRARREVDEARAVRLETDDFGAFLDDWYAQPLFKTLAQHEGLTERMKAARGRNDPHELARVLRGLGTGQQPSLWERLADLPVSTLAVAGALDGKYVEVAERMAVRSPRLRTVVVPNAGHNVHAEQPATFVNILKAFLTSPDR